MPQLTDGVSNLDESDEWIKTALNPNTQVIFLNTDTMIKEKCFLQTRSTMIQEGVENTVERGVLSNEHEVFLPILKPSAYISNSLSRHKSLLS